MFVGELKVFTIEPLSSNLRTDKEPLKTFFERTVCLTLYVCLYSMCVCIGDSELVPDAIQSAGVSSCTVPDAV